MNLKIRIPEAYIQKYFACKKCNGVRIELPIYICSQREYFILWYLFVNFSGENITKYFAFKNVKEL